MKHGHTGSDGGKSWCTATYKAWQSMKDRYKDKVCDRWKDFEFFWADMGVKPEGLTLARIDRTKDFAPGNCRWATYEEQNNNRQSVIKITYQGKTQSIAQWSRETGLSWDVIKYRHAKGWDPAKIFMTPVRKRNG